LIITVADYTSAFSVTWSFWNHCNMLILCSKKHQLLFLSMLKTVVYHFFPQNTVMN